MDEQRFFLSYSRQDLYFAQAVTRTLQAAGLNIWFDLQKLEPGCDWKTEISTGLENATDLILIVSPNALISPWVAKEWQAARASRKPIHLLIFEAVTFAPVIPEKGEPFDPTPLITEAASIIDARRDFRGAVLRLISALTSAARPRDAIPTPNQYHLPEKMPLAILCVAAALGGVVIVTLFITFSHLTSYLPLMLAGLIGSGVLAYQLLQFLRRESFFGARVSLILGTLLAVFFAFPLVPIFIVATGLVFRSPDVHRWSPLGQGLAHSHAAKPNRRSAHQPGDGCVMLLIPFMALVVIEPLLIIPGFVLMILTGLQQRRRGSVRRITDTVSRKFRVIAVAPDKPISDDIIYAMERAGHRLISGKQDRPELEILVATNEIEPRSLTQFQPADGARTVVVVGCGLDDPDSFSAFGNYQWIDYRRRDPDRLQAMADDLREEHGKSGNSYSTRTVPQDFRKILLPRTVAWYMVVQFFFYNLFFINSTHVLLMGGSLDFPNLISLLYGLGMVFFSVWMMNRVMRREIHIERIARLTISMVFFGALLGFIIGMLTPLPRGMIRPPDLFQNFLIINAIGVIVGYLMGKFYLRLVIGRWLPLGSSANPSGFPAFKRDAALWRRNALSAILSILLTLGFFGMETPVDVPILPPNATSYETLKIGTLHLDIPRHWLYTEVNTRNTAPYTRNVPIAAVLRRVDGPFNEATGVLINRTFQGGLSNNILTQLGDSISGVFDRIQASLSGTFDWSPEIYYGNPRYSRLLVETGQSTQEIMMTVWNFAPNTSRGVPPRWSVTTPASMAAVVVRGVSSTPKMSLISESNRAVENALFVNDITFSVTDALGEQTAYRLVIYDSGWRDYFVTFSGHPAHLQAQQAVIDTIVASGWIDR